MRLVSRRATDVPHRFPRLRLLATLTLAACLAALCSCATAVSKKPVKPALGKDTWQSYDGKVMPWSDKPVPDGRKPKAVVITVHGLSGAAMDFWMLEDEIAYDSFNYYIGLVESIFGANVKANYSGTQVKVLNIWGKDSRGRIYDVQSQLFYVPDAGMTAALLGFGLLSLAAFRRKL